MRSILVTGGAGFIGSHLVDSLLAEGHRVSVVDSLVQQVHGQVTGWPRHLAASDVTFVKADVCDRERWSHLLDGVDTVVHLAAEVGVGQSMYEIVRYTRGNTLAMAVLLEAMLDHRDHISKLVVASSMSIYGEGAYRCPEHGELAPRLRSVEQLQRREWEVCCDTCGAVTTPIPTSEAKPLYPTSIYAVNKRDHEEMALAFGLAYAIPTVALRFFNVYGPRQALSNPYTGVGAIFGSRLLSGKPPLVFEDGLQSRDFIHVSDIVQGLNLAIETDDVQNDVFNVGTGRPHSVLDVAVGLAKLIAPEIEPTVVNQFRAGDIRHCYSDISKIRRVLGFEPRVAFEDGLAELVAWTRGEEVADHVDAAYRELVERKLAQ